MKRIIISSTFLFGVISTLFLSTNRIYAQWVQTNGPYGGPVNCFAFSGTNVYAGTPYGLFFSTNNGTSWSAINNGLTNNNIICLVTSPVNGDTNIFAGTTGGVFLSTNNGSNWAAVNKGLTDTTINTLAVSSDSNNIYIFAGTANGIYRSTNNGLNWIPVDSGLTADPQNYDNISSILAVPESSDSNSNAMNLFAATWDGIFLSTNNGSTWAHINSVINNVNVLAFSATSNSTNLYAAEGVGMFISTDNGKNWIKRSSGFIDNSVTAFAVSPSKRAANSSDSKINLFAGTRSRGVYFSTDNGLSWTPMDTGLTNEYMLSLTINSTISGGTNLFAGTRGGAFLFSSNGKNWTSINTGISNTQLLSLTAVPVNIGANLLAGTETGIYLSTNYGISWDEVMNSNGLLNMISAFSFTEYTNNIGGINIFVGTANGIYLSQNYGASWSLVLPGVFGSSFVLIPNGSGTNIFAGTYNLGIYCSTDNGNSWNTVGNNLVGGVVYSMVSGQSATGGINIFAEIGVYIIGRGAVPGGISLSTDNGSTWNFITPVPFPIVNSLVIAVNGTYSLKKVVNLFAGTSKGVFLSIDNDTAWIYKGLGNCVVNSLLVYPVNSGADNYEGIVHIIAGTNQGVFLSTNDTDTNWIQISKGLTNLNVKALTLDSACIFAANLGGTVWRRPLSEIITTVNDKQNNLPKNFLLQQNYPNPFNPSTIISWQLSVGSFVTLKIYNVLGRDIKTLVNEYQTAGKHSLTFNAEGLPSGVYFYRLTCLPDRQAAGNFIQTKKLMVIK